MVYFYTASAVGWGVSREVQPLWLIGEFSALLAMRLGKFPNKLRYFPLANIRVAASIRFLHLQPSFFRWLHHPPCGLDLLLLLYRLCRLGQGLTAQVVVQVFVFTIVQRLVKQAFPEFRFQGFTGVPSCRVIVKVTADSGVGRQYAFRFREVGNGVQYDIVLRCQSRILRIVLHSNGEEREVIHEALKQITHISRFALLSDMGDVFRGDTPLEISVAHFISSCHIRKADGEIGFVGIHKPNFPAFSFGEFDVYSPFLQIGDERRG